MRVLLEEVGPDVDACPAAACTPLLHPVQVSRHSQAS